jgi:hypothetical protein
MIAKMAPSLVAAEADADRRAFVVFWPVQRSASAA